MAQYGLNLRLAYTWGVKKSVGRGVKRGAVYVSTRVAKKRCVVVDDWFTHRVY